MVFFLAVLTAILFAFYGPSTRGLYADEGNASFIILFTTFFRAVCLWLVCIWRGQKIFTTSRACLMALVGGVVQALSIVGILGALIFLPAPVMQIILFNSTIILMFIAVAKGDTQLSVNNILTTLITFIGLTFVVNFWNAEMSYEPMGFALATQAVLATAARVYVYAEQTKTRDPSVVGAENFIVAFVLLCVLPFFQPPELPETLQGWGFTGLATVSLVAGTFGLLYSLAHIGSFRVSLILKSEAVFNAVFSVLLLGEILLWPQYAGMLMVILALTVYQLIELRRQSVKKA